MIAHGTVAPSPDDLVQVQKFDAIMQTAIVSTNMHCWTCLDDPREFLDKLVSFNFVTVSVFAFCHECFVDAEMGKPPSTAKVKEFLDAMALGWTACAAPTLAIRKSQMASRVSQFAMPLIAHARAQANIGGDVAVEEDKPLSKIQSTTVETQYAEFYGTVPLPGQRAQPIMIGRMYRQLQTELAFIRLEKVFSSNDARLEDANSFVLASSGFKKKEPVGKIGDMPTMIKKLRLLINSYVLVAFSFEAPTTKWFGPAHHGVAGGKRRQATKSDGDWYLTFFEGQSENFRNHVQLFVKLEAQCRGHWTDWFSENIPLSTCMYESVNIIRGVVLSALSDIRRPKIEKTRFVTGGPSSPNALVAKGDGSGGGGPSGGKRSFADFSKLPNFKEGIATVAKDKSGKLICKFWNDGRVCRFADKCTKAHVCDVKMPDGSPCGATDHTRIEHP